MHWVIVWKPTAELFDHDLDEHVPVITPRAMLETPATACVSWTERPLLVGFRHWNGPPRRDLCV